MDSKQVEDMKAGKILTLFPTRPWWIACVGLLFIFINVGMAGWNTEQENYLWAVIQSLSSIILTLYNIELVRFLRE